MQKPKQFKPKRGSGGPVFNGRAKIDAMYDSSDWRSYSKLFLSKNPTCYACGKLSQVVDHIEAHKGDVWKFWKVDNFMPLCIYCHNTITAKFDSKPIPDKEGKLNWLAITRRLNDCSVRVLVVPLGDYGRSMMRT